jgi:hypothetical protein
MMARSRGHGVDGGIDDGAEEHEIRGVDEGRDKARGVDNSEREMAQRSEGLTISCKTPRLLCYTL